MKHKNEIQRWSKLPDGTNVWVKYNNEGEWYLLSKQYISWNPIDQFIVDDKFVEIRKAFLDGKQIEQKILWSNFCPEDGDRRWTEYETNDSNNINGFHNGTKATYRIKPKSIFKPGDWITNRNFSTPFQVDEAWIKNRPGGNTNKTGWDEDFSLWEPEVGEWIIFKIWTGIEKENEYNIRRYEKRMKLHNGLAPLQFVNQLKNKETK